MSLIATAFAEASVLFYGGAAGFDIGVTSANIDPTVSHGGDWDRGNNDAGLIGDGSTDGFNAFVIALGESVQTAPMAGFDNINPVDGANVLDINGAAIPPPAIPEPGTTSLVGFALIALAGFARLVRKPSTSRA